ncbi:MAG: hypothetical protein GF311_27790, partial [Candidatus Lokiarchaeota archaeon]|nr:hypothetical protein [Candidatus Lokiarchaeota archaeon]
MNSFTENETWLCVFILFIIIAGTFHGCDHLTSKKTGDVSVQNALPPVVYPPSGLIGRSVTNANYLEWNPNLEKDLSGYYIYRKSGNQQKFELLSERITTDTEYVDSRVTNRSVYEYRVTAVMNNGTESDYSNTLQLFSEESQDPEIENGTFVINVAGHERVVVENGIKVIFENTHSIIFDKELVRVRDWISDDGTHLIYPKAYGNPIDFTKFNKFGFSEPNESDKFTPSIPPRINLDYTHPHRPEKVNAWFIDYQVNDNAITFHYRIPLSGPGVPMDSWKDIWIWAEIWETWYPVEREIKDTIYSGLARKIELEMPSFYDKGYSLCLNDGFGVNGSYENALTYQLQWDKPHLNRIAWEKGVPAQGVGTIRGSRGFHPTQWATQVQPFLFANFSEGTLLISPRKYFYATSFVWSNYAEHEKDGLWPNFKIDCSVAGKRINVETFEYLWNSRSKLQPPQQWIDASFHYRRQLADLYQLNPQLTSLDYAWDYWGPGKNAVKGKSLDESLQVLRAWGEEMASTASTLNVDLFGGAHELWTSSPYTVSELVRSNEKHKVNQAIRDAVEQFNFRNIGFSYWIRPEFIKTALPNILSRNFVNSYYGYTSQYFPPAFPRLSEVGIPLIRENQQWIRVGIDGSHPERTPYNWTPMSITLKDGWYTNVIYKSIVMMKKLGMNSILQDGGFSCLTGVDYTNGETRAIQPYYWRYYQDLNRLGLTVNGECILGWGNANIGEMTSEDFDYLWGYVQTMNRGNRHDMGWFTAKHRHLCHQLYAGSFININSSEKHGLIAGFAQKFLEEHGHPDRVFLEDLHYDQ